jgi:hypothetical protein
MQDFEKLGAFYLGKAYDLDAKRPRDDLLLYDAKDLTTHGVCVGMTGSGKTGLCLALLEEAAIDGIPALIIDPKGDLGNLLLAFPELKPEDFESWIDPAEALRQGMTVAELATQTARQWRDGLAEWGQDASRIARFREAVDIAIYTPGSNAGLPITVLRSFAAPGPETMSDRDALRGRINAAVSGLLALLGIDADPLQSREHILLACLMERAWHEGRDLDLAQMIREIQTPPFDKIGVMDLESVFPAKDRFGLSMALNNLLASPGFSAWMEGEPLDIQRLLYTAAGKPRLSILSIAHLSDSERMFFVTIFLNEVIAWMRRQPGTTSLRALLYMDEVFGYFPPTANPPSKTPMLTLLKQARAFGLGVVLATQNPVDLDYKGLSNAGTWFIGRLQTERDKSRVLDGLEGASAAAGTRFNRQSIELILSSLGSRVFLLNNIHDDEPVVFQTRWALSYLRGPMTREQIAALMADRKENAAISTQPPPNESVAPMPATGRPAADQVVARHVIGAGTRPVLPPDVPEFFIPLRGIAPAAGVVYAPSLVGTARVHFTNSRSGIDVWETLTLAAPAAAMAPANAWDDARITVDEEPELEKSGIADARFAELLPELSRPGTYTDLTASLKDFLYRNHVLRIWKCPALKQFSRPGESEGDFRARLRVSAHEQRDLRVEKLRAKYAPKLGLVQEQLRRAVQKVEKEKSQATQQTMSAMLSWGSSLLGAMFGRKLASSANVNRAATAMRAAGRVSREKQDVAQAEENVQALRDRLSDLEAQFNAETAALDDTANPDELTLEEVEIKPRKSDITVTRVVLAWSPE